MNITESKAVKYAEWCIVKDNEKVPKYVKKQCAAWLEIVNGNDAAAYIDTKTFVILCKLLKIIIHPDLKKPMFVCMEPYAWLLVTASLCTRSRSDDS